MTPTRLRRAQGRLPRGARKNVEEEELPPPDIVIIMVPTRWTRRTSVGQLAAVGLLGLALLGRQDAAAISTARLTGSPVAAASSSSSQLESRRTESKLNPIPATSTRSKQRKRTALADMIVKKKRSLRQAQEHE